MLYSDQDVKQTKAQLIRRIVVMAVLVLVPNIVAAVLMYTWRNQVLSCCLSMLGVGAGIFYWAMACAPVYAYLKYLKEVLVGRNRAFSGMLKELLPDSVREGVACKALLFADDAGDEERLCYYDAQKLPKEEFRTGARYCVTVHGQSILAMQPE